MTSVMSDNTVSPHLAKCNLFYKKILYVEKIVFPKNELHKLNCNFVAITQNIWFLLSGFILVGEEHKFYWGFLELLGKYMTIETIKV